MASAQPFSVNPTSLTLSATAGTNVASRTVQVTTTNKNLRWTVVPPAVNWLTVSPANGKGAATLTLTFATAALAAGSYTTSFTVQPRNGTPVQVTVAVSITSPTPSVLSVTCPANKTVSSSTGFPVVVHYTATTSGGVPPITVTGNPPSGSGFPVGTTNVMVTAQSSDGQTASCSFTVTVTYTPPDPPTSTYGPQNVACPPIALEIFPGDAIQAVVDSNPSGTTYCLKAGVHSITAAITPKTGDVFVGEYGAVLDGTGWTTTDTIQGAFRAHDQDIDFVTVRNLVIRNMPQRGIYAFGAAGNWTIQDNEIGPARIGVTVSSGSVVRNNFIHGNSAGGYLVWKASDILFEDNQIAYNGHGQKIVGTSNVTFRRNWSHHNNDGIWYDTDNTGALIEDNLVEDNWREGIFYEISTSAIIRNNVIRRSNDTGILISTSKNVEAYGNTLEDNFRGVQFYLNCNAVGGGTIQYDLANNSVHDNSIKVGTRSGSWANTLNSLSSCTAAQVAPYANGSKNLIYDRNTYTVPSLTGQYWMWGYVNFKNWSEWQAIPQDVTSTLEQP